MEVCRALWSEWLERAEDDLSREVILTSTAPDQIEVCDLDLFNTASIAWSSQQYPMKDWRKVPSTDP